jgi:hypothetical protein
VLIVGYVLAVLVGLSLGLLGGGGSILTVPILHYVMGMGAQEAIASSLVVVALTSLVGLIPHWRQKRVSWSVGLPFGLASMVGAFVGGWTAQYIPGFVLMMLFAVIMIATSVTMIRGKKSRREVEPGPPKLWVSALLGAGVGAVTGLVGAGGGFLIVPALVIFGGLPIHLAIGTSLLTIVLKNAAALGGHIAAVSINWPVTLAFTAIAIVGSFFGARLVSRIRPDTLRIGFGWFVLIMGIVVIGTEIAGLIGSV